MNSSFKFPLVSQDLDGYVNCFKFVSLFVSLFRSCLVARLPAKRFVQVGVLLLLRATCTLGQYDGPDDAPGSRYQVKHFTDENGLPQNSVKSITQDLRGNIWLATERGLVRYDGKHFVKFDDFGSSYFDRNIYGFYLYPKAGHRKLIAVTEAKMSILIEQGKAIIDTDTDWNLLFHPIKDSRMLDYDQVFARMTFNDKMFFSRTSLRVPIYLCPDARYFAYDKNNLGYYADNKLQKVFSFPGKKYSNFFRVHTDLYYLDLDFSIFHFQGIGNDSLARRQTIRGDIVKHPDYHTASKPQIFWNNASDQVFVSLKSSLYLLEADGTGRLNSKLVLEGFDCAVRSVRAVYFDPVAGRVYLGTEREGLYIFERKPFRTAVAVGLSPDNIYYGQTIFDEKSVLTTEGIKFTLDPVFNNVSSSLISSIARATDWDQYSILKDRHGNIWTKQGNKLFRFDSSGKRCIAQWTITSGITQLYEGVEGRIWIGSSGDGLFYIDPREPAGRLRFFLKKNLINISWIQRASDESLWIGTGRGLFKVDLRTGRIAVIKGLENIYIRSLHITPGSQQLWIATYTSGIFLLDGARLTGFPLDKQEHLASAHCIFEDVNGFFWITTNRGLFKVRKRDLLAYSRNPFELYYHYYSKTAGFNTNEFNGGCQPCAVRVSNGTVSLPSLNGLVWFVPEQVRAEQPDKQIFIDEVAVDGKSVRYDRDFISVQADVSEIILKVTTPYFGDLYNLKMSYRVSKNGKSISGWKELDENGNITMALLGGGNYTLCIRKINGFGVANYGYKNITIHVEMRWYETLWFLLLIVAVVALLFYIVLKQRVKAIRSQNQLLEAKIKERTHDLERALNVLSNSEKRLEEQLKLHIHLIASISHDIRTPIRHMSNALDHSQELIEKNEPDEAVIFIKLLRQGVDRIYMMVDNIVNFIKPEIRGNETGMVRVGLYELVNEKVSLFRQISNASYRAIDVAIPPEKTVFTDTKLLGIIVHNLIDNAIKVEEGNVIRIYTERQKGVVHLIFQDNGPGMPTELITWLNASVFDESQNLPVHYEGLGLLMVRQIAKILRLQIYVENNPGTCFHLIFIENNP